jgi:hypothetical protein
VTPCNKPQEAAVTVEPREIKTPTLMAFKPKSRQIKPVVSREAVPEKSRNQQRVAHTSQNQRRRLGGLNNPTVLPALTISETHFASGQSRSRERSNPRPLNPDEALKHKIDITIDKFRRVQAQQETITKQIKERSS